ncbi:baculoviral IAP repeat-containing protein 3-like isoform X3 [Physella acuta]|uniref:baculoviral IAP repeat-containing protein 3-like isoform X2 n=1 Tax=Physella acuta TaxID=109671 RepID=UPI0027DC926E|nr:baculoviral IAP repeat-containing protein 3-like isoform X2 [Physella acuta]XP_059160171.1 baculoviral IAP repeat-containing protein 3-like isoform X3 [Physella acuta]
MCGSHGKRFLFKKEKSLIEYGVSPCCPSSCLDGSVDGKAEFVNDVQYDEKKVDENFEVVGKDVKYQNQEVLGNVELVEQDVNDQGKEVDENNELYEKYVKYHDTDGDENTELYEKGVKYPNYIDLNYYLRFVRYNDSREEDFNYRSDNGTLAKIKTDKCDSDNKDENVECVGKDFKSLVKRIRGAYKRQKCTKFTMVTIEQKEATLNHTKLGHKIHYKHQGDSSKDNIKCGIKDTTCLTNFRPKPHYYEIYFVPNASQPHPSELEGMPWSWFHDERFRIATFVSYPRTCVKSPLLLAANGFVYIGMGSEDIVMCYFCCGVKNNWGELDNILEVHRVMSPECPIVTGNSCDNVPLNSLSFPTSFGDMLRNCFTEIDSAPTPGQASSQVVAEFPQQSQNRALMCGSGNRSFNLEESGLHLAGTSAPTNIVSNDPQTVRTNQTINTENGGLDTTSLVLPSGSYVHNPSQSTATNTYSSNTQLVPAVSQPSTTSPAHPTLAHISTTATGSLNTTLPIQTHSTAPTVSHTSVSSTPAELRRSIPSSTHNQQTGRDRPTNTPTSTNGQHASRDRPTNTPTSTNGQHASRDRPTPTYSELGILTERPKRADYALKVKRQESFAGWPRGHHLSVESLVDAGFYYGGYGDCARCFYCGGGLRNWEDEDDVLVEHARWFPKCGYLRQTLGQAFIDTVQNLNTDRDQISLKLVADTMGVAESDLCVMSKENLTRDAAVRAVVDLGYLFADVLQAAELVKQEANILSADNIIEKLDLLGKRLNIRRNSEPAVDPSKILENIRAMKEENNQLRLQTICKICMDKEVSVVFLPCGHLVSCGECAVAMRDCPVCRVNVKGIVKASMG